MTQRTSGAQGATQNKHDEHYQFLLMQYASGCLDQAQSMIVTAHLGLSTKGHSLLRQFTSLGGNMLEDNCKPVKMKGCSLESVLKQLENPKTCTEQTPTTKTHLPEGHCTTSCIQKNLKTDESAALKWKNLIPGIQIINLPLDCTKSKARLFKVKPGTKTPAHEHHGLEITLLLDGAMYEDDQRYTVGDLIVHDADTGAHSPKSCATQGCVCLTVTTAPIKLVGLARFLSPFIGRNY